MRILDDGTLVYTASDLTASASCEYAVMAGLDVRLGLAVQADRVEDEMLARAGRLGEAHERRVLERYEALHGSGTVAMPRPVYTRQGLEDAAEATGQAWHSGASVVHQGSFFDGRFHGLADFLVRVDGVCQVLDAKLARRERVGALLQVASYAEQVGFLGIPVHPEVGLILGDVDLDHLAPVTFPTADLLAVHQERRTRFQALVDAHVRDSVPVTWGDPRYAACGRCATCQAAVEATRDVLLVAGLRVTQRSRLREAGIATIEELAGSTEPVPGIGAATLERLRDQATMQVAQDAAGVGPDGRPVVSAKVIDSGVISAMPAPDPGDIFFDFEGDPLWQEPGSPDAGLEYLFGWVAADTGTFDCLWAHDRVQEHAALVAFLDLVSERRRAHPGMHVYHYAPYETTALKRLVGRHGVGEDILDDLLRAGVFVDLYSVVRRAIRVSQPSYSIKKLEPLYMGDELREGVDTAADSVIQYAEACDLALVGDEPARALVLEDIRQYNAYDCRSTMELRDWLIGLADPGVAAPAEPATVAASAQKATDDAALVAQLMARAGDEPAHLRSPDQQAWAMLAAALGYHRREDKPFWWEHFDRLRQPDEDWLDGRDVFRVEEARVLEDWFKEGKQKNVRRRLELAGTWGPGSTIREGGAVAVYAAPTPVCVSVPADGIRGTHGVSIESMGIGSDGRDVVEVLETAGGGVPGFDDLPIALAPGSPPPTGSLVDALRQVCTTALSLDLPVHPGLDVLRRRSLVTAAGGLPAISEAATGVIDAVVAAVTGLPPSYLAVQGPPGTGKTYVGARVVKTLVELGWRVGVVAQSHAVVEHFLDGCENAGVPPRLIGKHVSGGSRSHAHATWESLPSRDAVSLFLDQNGGGCVVGGTAWDFSNRGRVQLHELDLLVIDEAGQFSLANTLAVSTAAQRLLLLGDPQQLPQVSQGTHPEPVNGSALGWLAEGRATLPADRGYFLERTWRLHPELCAGVSALSYDERLNPQRPQTEERHLDVVAPGVRTVVVEHEGRSVESPEEAAAVVEEVRRVLSGCWTPGAGEPQRPMTQRDVLVVAPYNAQVALIRRTLAEAGLGEVRVGTVDKFQGQEAPIVVVSMTASSSEDVPRGMEFLLLRNRINVAVSRAQWQAVVVRSRTLTHHLPTTSTALLDLGGFIRLTGVVP